MSMEDTYREYGQEYADSLLIGTRSSRCKHGSYYCQQCIKEHEAKKEENKTPSLSSLNN